MNTEKLEQKCHFFVNCINTSKDRAHISKEDQREYRKISGEVFCLCNSLNIDTEKGKRFYVDKNAKWEIEIKKEQIDAGENNQTIYVLSLIENDYDQDGGKDKKYDFATIMENAITTNIESHIDNDFSWKKCIERAELVREFVKHMIDDPYTPKQISPSQPDQQSFLK